MKKLCIAVMFLLFSVSGVHSGVIKSSGTISGITYDLTFPEETMMYLVDLLRSYQTRNSTKEEKKENERIKKEITLFIDIGGMGQEVMGEYWEKFNSRKQKEFTKRLTYLVERFGYPFCHDQLIRTQIIYLGTDFEISKDTSTPTIAIIFTENYNIVSRVRMLVDYVMRENADGGWVLYDIRNDGVSVIAFYRDYLDRIVKEEGIFGIFRLMKEAKSIPKPV